MTKFLENFLKDAWLFVLIAILAACQSQVQKPQSDINKFSDPVIVQIYDHQDKRDVSSLLNYFNHEEATYRAAAALAFGTVQDTSVIPMLGHLLNDDSPQVRTAAAYALGQSYDSASIQYLAGALHHEDSVFVRKELLEALGKVITQPKIALLYNQPDLSQKEKEGLSWGLYRAGLRNVHDNAALALGVSYLAANNSYSTRLAAAHFLARTKNTDLTSYADQLIRSATSDTAADVRMAATTALKKIPTDGVLGILSERARKDTDHRVRVNALRALSAFEYNAIKATAFAALKDENINVAIAAAILIDDLAIAPEDLHELRLEHFHHGIKTALLGTTLKITENKSPILDQIRQQYVASSDPYYKAALLTALGHSLYSYDFLVAKIFSAQHPAISTAGINALAHLRRQENFPDKLKPAFANFFKRAIASGDIALVAVSSKLLIDPDLNFRAAYDDYDFLYQAKHQLSLPKDNEALQALNRTIAYFEGKDQLPETTNDYNNPIDWALVKTIEKDQHVRIITAKGNIMLRLLVENAPGSVANFVSLSKSGYFNSLNFHRVVPNFVIQGGCNRGDGYGGEDYSIRSEFASLNYNTGTVGMASAGKDTEGTQWFITHAPTPHLDGRYTIFAQVTDGMDVIHQMEVGDKILAVEMQ